ncbi:MAG: ABC transporter substrate-binding protein [Culicoidibacterales bacterium]
MMLKKHYLFIGVIGIISVVSVALGTFIPRKLSVANEAPMISFASWTGSPLENMVIDHVIDNFTAETGILVERETFSQNYNEILTSQFRNNQGPDVFFVDQAMYSYWQKRGWLAKMEPYMNKGADYIPAIRELFSTDGEFYAVPKDFSTIVLFINETLLEAAGYSIAEIPTTLHEFLPFLSTLQAQLPAEVTAMIIEARFENFMSVFKQLDPEAFATNQFAQSAPIAEFFAQLRQLIAEGAFSLVNETSPLTAAELFREQKSIFTLEGNWLFAELEYYELPFTYRVLPLPTVNDQTHTVAFFTGYGINSSSSEPTAAGQFIAYLTSAFEPYILGRLKTFPTQFSLVEKAIPASKPYVREVVNQLEVGTIWNTQFKDLLYSHFFSLEIANILTQNGDLSQFFVEIDTRSAAEEALICQIHN